MTPSKIAFSVAGVLFVGLGIWLMLPAHPAAETPAAATAATAADKGEAPKTGQATAPAPGKAEEPKSSAGTAPINPNDPRLNLSTTIGDMIHRLETNDLGGFLTTYAPPGVVDNMLQMTHMTTDQFVQNAIAQPGFKEQTVQALQSLHSIQTATPVYNTAGDEATYQIVPPPAAGPKSLTFQKINGLWYMKQ